MFLASFLFGNGALLLFNRMGYFQPGFDLGKTAIATALIAAAATLV
ncbi:hypothetical protein XM38_030750 [Halomicronema hongdechloris C2206]|uniref:Uncharacterized protein n=1 Tax=Halomicronema hongdechloris C2206 TaxID=1641165 RepID=A0A1Z3HP98_9CYAN|nr:hypothetical protein [Halomicronema hongdechloris]ASC72121.1 hypothetical protein XM38_030750 [Halomicronema hongdechloris C2206]